MRRGCLLFVLVMALFAARGHAQTICPWVNQATVTDSPDEAVKAAEVTVTPDGNHCTFRFTDVGREYSIEVNVQNVSDSNANHGQQGTQCTSARNPLSGIGNEAFACSIHTRHLYGEQVTGRVRDKSFLVVMSTKQDLDPSSSKQLSDRAILIAEQVVGNMY